MTETFLRKSPDLPVSDSRSPAPNTSDTRSLRLAVRAKSLQVRNAGDGLRRGKGSQGFRSWTKQRDDTAVQMAVEFDSQN